MIIIGIDPSLNSTAVSVLNKNTNEIKHYSFTNIKPNYKWAKEYENFILFKFHTYKDSKEFSESEVLKLNNYDDVSNTIMDVILEYKDTDVKIFMEGYSYSSKNGRIIDLVVFSTLLRYKIITQTNAELNIIPPSSLKMFVGQNVYEPDKKGVYRNNDGKAAGKFDKHDIMKALLDLNMTYDYINKLNEDKSEILQMKSIPKPLDDVNDSILLCYYGAMNNQH
jgi:hypothetical protein